MFIFQVSGESNERVIKNGWETRIVNKEFAPKEVAYETKTTLVGPKERMAELDTAENALVAAADTYFKGAKDGKPQATQDKLEALKKEFVAAFKQEFGQALMNTYSAGQTVTGLVNVENQLKYDGFSEGGPSLEKIIGKSFPNTGELITAYRTFKETYGNNVAQYMPNINQKLDEDSAKKRNADNYSIRFYERPAKPEPATANDLGRKVSTQGLGEDGWRVKNQPEVKIKTPIQEAH